MKTLETELRVMAETQRLFEESRPRNVWNVVARTFFANYQGIGGQSTDQPN